MTTTKYKQCLLKRDNSISQIAWIPENFAVVNKDIRIKDGKFWEQWQIVKVYFGIKTKEQVDLSENVDREFRTTLG